MSDKEYSYDIEKYLDELPFQNLKVFVPSIEILACCKLFSKRVRDLEDLKRSDILLHCNKSKLLSLIKEYKEGILNDDHPDYNYHHLSDIFKEKGI